MRMHGRCISRVTVFILPAIITTAPKLSRVTGFILPEIPFGLICRVEMAMLLPNPLAIQIAQFIPPDIISMEVIKSPVYGITLPDLTSRQPVMAPRNLFLYNKFL